MIQLKLPNWAQGLFLTRLVVAIQAWFEQVENWLNWPLQQLDVRTCHPDLLEAIAYQRYVRPIKGESIDLYRLRIQTAFLNAQDAGTTSGLKRILERLGIEVVGVKQEIPGRHWAVVEIEISDASFSQHGAVLQEIMSAYGRLCRTYEMKVNSPLSMNVRVGAARFISRTVVAK